jgi:hypothetical protein
MEGSVGDLEVEDEIPAALFKHLPEAAGCVARCRHPVGPEGEGQARSHVPAPHLELSHRRSLGLRRHLP